MQRPPSATSGVRKQPPRGLSLKDAHKAPNWWSPRPDPDKGGLWSGWDNRTMLQQLSARRRNYLRLQVTEWAQLPRCSRSDIFFMTRETLPTPVRLTRMPSLFSAAWAIKIAPQLR